MITIHNFLLKHGKYVNVQRTYMFPFEGARQLVGQQGGRHAAVRRKTVRVASYDGYAASACASCGAAEQRLRRVLRPAVCPPNNVSSSPAPARGRGWTGSWDPSASRGRGPTTATSAGFHTPAELQDRLIMHGSLVLSSCYSDVL